MTKQKNNSKNRKETTSFYKSLEEYELERRWPIAVNELKSLFQRLKDIRGPNPEKLPENISETDKKRLLDALFESIMTDSRPELNRSVVRRMVNKMGDYMLWRRESGNLLLTFHFFKLYFVRD